MLKIIHFKVNGRDVELAVDERESLLDALRVRLDLTSVKKGCEVGECGDRIYRRSSGAVRLLYSRTDSYRCGDCGNRKGLYQRRVKKADFRTSLPLHRL